MLPRKERLAAIEAYLAEPIRMMKKKQSECMA
jgi:hypothetical protein